MSDHGSITRVRDFLNDRERGEKKGGETEPDDDFAGDEHCGKKLLVSPCHVMTTDGSPLTSITIDTTKTSTHSDDGTNEHDIPIDCGSQKSQPQRPKCFF